MTISEKLQELKNWLDENSMNLTDSNVEKLTEQYIRMKEKYGV